MSKAGARTTELSIACGAFAARYPVAKLANARRSLTIPEMVKNRAGIVHRIAVEPRPLLFQERTRHAYVYKLKSAGNLWGLLLSYRASNFDARPHIALLTPKRPARSGTLHPAGEPPHV